MALTTPLRAFCAVRPGPNAALDLDLIRRSAASAEYAASQMQGGGWRNLSLAGWRVLPVLIMEADLDAVASAAEPADKPTKRTRTRPTDETGAIAGAAVRRFTS